VCWARHFSSDQAVMLKEGGANREGKRRLARVRNIEEAIAMAIGGMTTGDHLLLLHLRYASTYELKRDHTTVQTRWIRSSCTD
jgi:hypothetical protein